MEDLVAIAMTRAFWMMSRGYLLGVLLTAQAMANTGMSSTRPPYNSEDLIAKLSRPGGRPSEPIQPEFDCFARLLAYNVSKLWQPERGDLQVVWDALQLTSLCNFTLNSISSGESLHPSGKVKRYPPLSDRPSWFVDSQNGSDASPGTLVKPFATISRAVEASRGVEGEPRIIYLRGGVHQVSETLIFDEKDSFLTLSGYNGEEAIVNGGIPLQVDWRPLLVESRGRDISLYSTSNVGDLLHSVAAGDSTPKARFQGVLSSQSLCMERCAASDHCKSWTWFGEGSADWTRMCYFRTDRHWAPKPVKHAWAGYCLTETNIYVANVSGQLKEGDSMTGLLFGDSYSNLRRATRARFPNVDNVETTLFPEGWVSGGADYHPPRNIGIPLYITSSEPVDVTKFLFKTFRLGIDGPCSVFTPPESYWCSETPEGGSAEQFELPSGITFHKNSLPNLPYKSNVTNSAIVHVWRPYHWANWMFEIDSYDAETSSMNWTKGGFQGARGEKTGAEWFIENVIEELDHPNEFFYDKNNQMLHFFYNGTGAPPKTMLFIAPSTKTLLSIEGSQLAPVVNFTVQGLKFISTAATFMDPHGVPSGGDWGLQRSAAVQLEGVQNAAVQGCVFERLDGNALLLSGYNRFTVIQDNEFVWIGDTAMVAWGNTEMVDGMGGEQPRQTLVRSNLIHELGLFQKQSSCWFQAKSAQNIIERNICFNGPRAGININDGFGGGNFISENVLFNLCRESSDHGPFNSWDRQPFLTLIGNHTTPSLQPAFNEILRNLMICNYGSSTCVDNDDGSSYYNIQNNYLVYGGHKSNFAGHNKISRSNYNIYPKVYFTTCMLLSPTVGPEFPEVYENNTCVLPRQNNTMYFIRTDSACDLKNRSVVYFQTRGNRIYAPNKEVTVRVCNRTFPSGEWLEFGLDNGTTIHDSTDIGTMIQWGRDLFGV